MMLKLRDYFLMVVMGIVISSPVLYGLAADAGLTPCLTCDPDPKAEFYTIENVTYKYSVTTPAPLMFDLNEFDQHHRQYLCVRACNEHACSECAYIWYIPVQEGEEEPDPSPPVPVTDYDLEAEILRDQNNGCFIGGTLW